MDIAPPYRFGLASPLGPIEVWVEDGAIIDLTWGIEAPPAEAEFDHEIVAQLDAYFGGSEAAFTLPLRPRASEFQARFYDALIAIPYGYTKTYGDLSKELGVPAQAIGQACGANTIPILIPCHRVLGASSLGGFSGDGGVESKVQLLKLEGAASLLL